MEPREGPGLRGQREERELAAAARPATTVALGRFLLLAAALAAPWPYGAVTGPWRPALAAAVFLGAALVALRADLRPGLAVVAPLAALPLLQVLLGTAPAARTLEAAFALWAPLAAWLALRSEGAGRRGSTVAAVVATSAPETPSTSTRPFTLATRTRAPRGTLSR